MESDALAELHGPLIPILRHALALTPLPRAGVALDLACGPGLKLPLLAEAFGPGVRLVGIDRDAAAIRAAIADCRLRTTHYALRNTQYESFVFRPSSFVVGDALALPLRDGCLAAAFCSAALGLFADGRAALREVRRALRPGGLALIVAGTQMWAPIVCWPADLAARLGAAYARALAEGIAPLPASPDLGADLSKLLGDAGFGAPLVRAFLLADRRPTTDDRRPTTDDEGRTVTCDLRPATCDLLATDAGQPTTDDGRWTTAELPLLAWPALRSLLAGRLAANELARCDRVAAEAQIALCPLALIGWARAS